MTFSEVSIVLCCYVEKIKGHRGIEVEKCVCLEGLGVVENQVEEFRVYLKL